MNHKKLLFFILCFLIQLHLPGCGAEPYESIGESSQLYETQGDKSSNHVSAEYSNKDKTLVIDADVGSPTPSDVPEVQLAVSDMYLSRMVEEYVSSKNENLNEIFNDETIFSAAAFDGDNLQLSFSVDKSGYVNYLDVQNDIQCTIHEIDHLYDDGFFTSLIPAGMSITSLDAAEIAARFLETYSCFSYQPWNVLAADAIDGSQGCYYVFLQAKYDQIPIVQKSAANVPGINALVLVSSNGIFQFSGIIMLEPSQEKKVGKIVPLASVIQQFSDDFAKLAIGESISVTNISFCYISEVNNDGLILLKPAWCFNCIDTRTKMENWETNEGPIIKKYIVAYYAENGSFCGVYY